MKKLIVTFEPVGTKVHSFAKKHPTILFLCKIIATMLSIAIGFIVCMYAIYTTAVGFREGAFVFLAILTLLSCIIILVHLWDIPGPFSQVF